MNQVRLLKNIWDNGEDHHPPGFIARAGDVLDVLSSVSGKALEVRHSETITGSFYIYPNEFEWVFK